MILTAGKDAARATIPDHDPFIINRGTKGPFDPPATAAMPAPRGISEPAISTISHIGCRENAPRAMELDIWLNFNCVALSMFLPPSAMSPYTAGVTDGSSGGLLP